MKILEETFFAWRTMTSKYEYSLVFFTNTHDKFLSNNGTQDKKYKQNLQIDSFTILHDDVKVRFISRLQNLKQGRHIIC